MGQTGEKTLRGPCTREPAQVDQAELACSRGTESVSLAALP